MNLPLPIDLWSFGMITSATIKKTLIKLDLGCDFVIEMVA